MPDAINPSHYKTESGIQCIDVIDSFGLGFCLGNSVKYILRHKNKAGVEDLQKARWYLNRVIITGEPAEAAWIDSIIARCSTPDAGELGREVIELLTKMGCVRDV